MNDKPNIILIGGGARLGKTTFVSKLLKKLPYYVLSTDNLKYMGQKFGVMKDESTSEDWNNSAIWLEKIRKRDYEVWNWTKEYIISATKSHKSLIVEGNLWPDYIIKDIEQFRNANIIMLFMTDTSSEETIYSYLVNLKENDPYNWLNDYDNDKLKAFSSCSKIRSEKLKQLCTENNCLVYDVKDYNSLDEMQEDMERLIVSQIKII